MDLHDAGYHREPNEKSSLEHHVLKYRYIFYFFFFFVTNLHDYPGFFFSFFYRRFFFFRAHAIKQHVTEHLHPRFRPLTRRPSPLPPTEKITSSYGFVEKKKYLLLYARNNIIIFKYTLYISFLFFVFFFFGKILDGCILLKL